MVPTTTSYERALDRLLRSPTLPKLGLRRMEALCEALGRPQDRFASLHIAGTKGKGSTSAMAASVLRQAGLRVGLTTSPHLLSARERIVIDGALIDEATFVSLERRVDAAARTLSPSLEVPSFFERLTAMALCAFAEAGVDVAVIEVGLGGRLDATNVVRPVACAITRLGMDHMEFLGPTLGHIAAEKAGIIKAGVPVVTTTQEPEAAAVVVGVARRLGAPLTIVVDGRSCALSGAHQRDNAAIASALVTVSGLLDPRTVAGFISAGLDAVQWPGRYETVGRDPLVIVDGAHDGLAAGALATTIADDPRLRRPLHLVLGVSRGHAPAELLAPLSSVPWASVVSTQAAHPRALPGSEVARAALGLCPVVDVVADVGEAVAVAVRRARSDGGAVVVTGSLFVVGEARAAFIAMPKDPVRPAW